MFIVQSTTSTQASHSNSHDNNQPSQRLALTTNNRLSPKMHELLIKYQAFQEDSKACISQETT